MADFELNPPSKQESDGDPQFSGDDFSTTEITRVLDLQQQVLVPIQNGIGCATGLNTDSELADFFSSRYGDVAFSFTLGAEMLGSRLHQQQDAMCAYKNGIAVADGLGGESEGREASDNIIGNFYRLLEEGIEFSQAFLRAINEFSSYGKTTFTAFQINDGKLNTLSIGDSMVLVFRDGKLVCNTEEHTTQNLLLTALEKGSHEELADYIKRGFSVAAFNSLQAQCSNWSEISKKEQVEHMLTWYVKNEALIRRALVNGNYAELAEFMKAIFPKEEFYALLKESSKQQDPTQQKLYLENIVQYIAQHTLIHRSILMGNGISESVGRGSNPKIDQQEFELKTGDIIIIATDGLFPYALKTDQEGDHYVAIDNLVTDEDLEKVVSEFKSPESILRKLESIARERGSVDNLAIAVVEYRPNMTDGQWIVEDKG